MVPTEDSKRSVKNVAKGKSSTAKGGKSGAGKYKVPAGPSGKMQKFTGVKTQKPGVSHVTNTGGGGYAKK
jgi:hypothetical protein